MSLIPYYLYEEGIELPDSGNYYIIARNGVFVHKDCGHTKGIVKAETDSLPFIKDLFPVTRKAVPIYVHDDGMSELPRGPFFVIAKNGLWENKPQCNLVKSKFEDLDLGRIQTSIRFDLPKIPLEVTFKALTFFRRVWYQYRAEAAVVLYYHGGKKEYHVRCPSQEVSGGSVRYGSSNGLPDPSEQVFESTMRLNGFVKVGTIHSHCNFSAYHSGVDTGDEADWPDGVHVTLGHVDSHNISVASSLVINVNRFQVKPPTIMLGLIQDIGFRQVEHFKIDLNEEEETALIDKWHAEIEEEWMPKVVQVSPWIGKWNWQEKHPKTPDPVENSVVRICPHCNRINMEKPGKLYRCKQCHKLVEPYPGWAKEYESLPDLPTGENVVQHTVGEETPQNDDFLSKVRKHANALRNHAGHIPKERLAELLGTLKKFFGKDVISDEDINLACQVNPKRKVTPSNE